jgi:ribosome maturation factor RimP
MTSENPTRADPTSADPTTGSSTAASSTAGGSTRGASPDRLPFPEARPGQGLGAELEEGLRLAARSTGCDILEAGFRGGRLQIVLDHPDGTTLAHCEEVSKKVSALLDVSDFGDARYVLEVSSPGLDRKLYGPADYARFAGRLARVTWRDPVKGKRTDVGRLGDAGQLGDAGPTPGDADGAPARRVALDVGGKRLDIPLTDVLEARLEIEI